MITYFDKNTKLASVGDFQIRFEILNNNKLYGDKLYFFFEGIHRFSERFSEKTIKEKIEKADPVLRAMLRSLLIRLNDMNVKGEDFWRNLNIMTSLSEKSDN